MGGWDINCSICGASFKAFDPYLVEGNNWGYDEEVISESELEWLESIRVIGFNPEAFGVRKCFITGKGNEEEYGQVVCDVGDDPNVPPTTQNTPGTTTLVAYSNYDPNEPVAFPFHEDCFIFLSKTIHCSLHGKVPLDLSNGESITGEGDEALGFVSKTALYAAMKKLYEMDSYDHCLSKVDYAELSVLSKEQYWYCSRGQEAWVSNPLTSHALSSFLTTTFPTLGLTPSSSPPSLDTTFSPPPTPLSKLPKELISEILLYLPFSTLKSLAVSGLLPSNHLSQNPSFWHRKTSLDFPFLYDLPEVEGERNWLAIYQELRRQCYATTITERNEQENRDKSLVLGLANRRRVWGSCEQIVGEYVECLEEVEEDEGGEVEKSVVEKSLSLAMPVVGNPLPNDGKGVSVYFVGSWAELGKGLVLRFFFEEGGVFCGVDVQGKRLLGVKSERFEEVVIEEGNWIEALVLVISGGSENCLMDASIGVTGIEIILEDGQTIKAGNQTGDKRLLKVNAGMVITGLIGELGNGIITRLGLLQAPNPSSTSANSPSKTISPTHKPLYHTSLPPLHIHASSYQTGYWTPSRTYDTIPMSYILFSPTGTYSELSSLTSISSDPHMRSWGVQYSDQTSRITGPQDKPEEVKSFKIDGESGERVVKVEIGMNSLVKGVKITTNKSRTAFFGHTQKYGSFTYQESESAFIAGLYISWGYDDERRICSTVSILSAAKPGHGYEEGKIEGVLDRTVWNPERKVPSMIGEDEYVAFVEEGEGEGLHW